MWQIFLGSIVLSLIHASIPNHWIPIIAISKIQKWTYKETISATFIIGFAHMMSTIIIGIIVGFLGIKLSENYDYIIKIAAPLVLLSIGVIYLLLDLKSDHRHHHHKNEEQIIKNKKSKFAIISSLSIAMFLSPCLEIEAYYFQAASLGWIGILIVSTTYLAVTMLSIIALVHFGLKGVNKFNFHFLENHDKMITGIVLILLGLLAYFVEF
ncbi:MAG: hypothetical protein KKG99_03265 [Bacteroidetes bacterium]|nr:hypothetical protein [Bacteroidota bacterium]